MYIYINVVSIAFNISMDLSVPWERERECFGFARRSRFSISGNFMDTATTPTEKQANDLSKHPRDI